MKPTLHACASRHIAHKNTRLAPLYRWHGGDHKTCRHNAHSMHTQNAMKMTNHQVMLNPSSQHHIAVLQRGLGH